MKKPILVSLILLKHINIICRCIPIRQTVPHIYNPVDKIKFAHIIFRTSRFVLYDSWYRISQNIEYIESRNVYVKAALIRLMFIDLRHVTKIVVNEVETWYIFSGFIAYFDVCMSLYLKSIPSQCQRRCREHHFAFMA